MSRAKLFCLPYAGGSAVIFKKWKQYLDPGIELKAIEYAGRGVRIGEGLYKNLTAAIEDVFWMIKEDIRDCPYALFGHSLGGLIVYEIAQKIRNEGFPPPLHIFISGKSAPHIEREDEKKYHLMNDDEFRRELIDLGGTPPEFFENPELLKVFLPILKNDFKLAETAPVEDCIRPLDGGLTVFLGKDDDQTAAQCDGWKIHTRQFCSVHYFDGGHFFLHDETEQLVKLINAAMERPAGRSTQSSIGIHATQKSY